MSKREYKIELNFTKEEMENYLLYSYPCNYRWKDKIKKDVMIYGTDTVVKDIKEEFTKCFKDVLLRQRWKFKQR
jgi:hypothetical protein